MFEKSDKSPKSFFDRNEIKNSDVELPSFVVDEETRSLLEANVAAIPNATAVFDRSCEIVCMNDYFLGMWGFRSQSEALGISLEQLWQNKAINQSILDCLDLTGDWSGELVGLRGIGMPIDVHVSARLTGSASHTPGYVFMSFIDISERKQAENLIQKSETRLYNATNVALLGSIEWDLETGETQYSSEVFKILGLDPETADQGLETYLDSIHPDDREEARAAGAEMLDNKDFKADSEYRIVRPDGEIRHISARGAYISNVGETPSSVTFTLLDITESKEARLKLIASQTRNDAIIQAITDLVYETDENGMVTYVSKTDDERGFSGALVQLGTNYADKVKEFVQLGGGISASGIDSAIDVVEKRQLFHDFITSVTYEDGTKKTWLHNGTPRFDDEGTFRGYTMSQRDISHRAASERTIQQQSLVMQHMTDTVLIVSADGIVEDVNPAFEKQTGYPPESILGKNGHLEVRRILGSEIVPMEQIKDAFDRQGFWQGDSIFTHKSGRRIHTEVTTFPLAPGDGPAGGRAIVVRNVTDQKMAELELLESENRLRGIMGNAAVGMATIDGHGLLETFNPAAEDIFGYKSAEVIGKNVALLMPEPDSVLHDAYLKTFSDTGISGFIGKGNREVIAVRKDGTEFPLELAIAEMIIGERRTFIGSFLDVSDKKNTERRLQQSQKMEAVGQLTGGIAHDFNNMLGAMMLNLELLEGELTDNTTGNEILATVLSTVNGGAALTQRLLSFSRQQALEIEIVDVNKVAASLKPLLRRALSTEILLKQMFERKPWHARIDTNQLENAILNLSINARDAMPKGGTLTIATTNFSMNADAAAGYVDTKPGDYVRVSVSDTGTGIPPEILEHILEPFYTTKEQGKGTGLGLSMVYGFVQQSGGTFNIMTEEGQGTTMEMFFPRAEVDETVEGLAVADATETKTPAVAPSEPNDKPHTILVVEDNIEIQKIVVMALSKLGYDVVAKDNGPEAIIWLENEGVEPALILTDMIMPGGMSGLDIAAKVAERYPNCKTIAMSGYTDADTSEHEHLIKGLQFLSKPFSLEALHQKIAQVLQ